MKPYSLDIRERVVEAYMSGEGTQRDVARRFSVSLSFVQSILKRYKETGSLEPKPHGGGYPPKIDKRGLQLLQSFLDENPSATLDKLCERYALSTGVAPSRVTMWRAVRKLMRRGKSATPQPRAQSATRRGATHGQNVNI